jgi:hypothetical protein
MNPNYGSRPRLSPGTIRQRLLQRPLNPRVLTHTLLSAPNPDAPQQLVGEPPTRLSHQTRTREKLDSHSLISLAAIRLASSWLRLRVSPEPTDRHVCRS